MSLQAIWAQHRGWGLRRSGCDQACVEGGFRSERAAVAWS
jgi:hypothetical protein